MTAVCRLGIAVLLVSLASTVVAQPQAGTAELEAFYSRLRDRTISVRRGQIERIEGDARSLARSSQVSVRAPSLATANATTAAELAQAAINTSVAGADAGISVSPLALMGKPDSTVQLPITFAALQDGVTRVQIGVTVQLESDLHITAGSCILNERDLYAAIERERTGYLEVCQRILELQLPASAEGALMAKQARFVTMMRRACGVDGAPPGTVITGTLWITDGLKILNDLYSSLPESDPTRSAALEALGRVATSTEKFSSYKESAPDDCEQQSEDALRDAAVRAAWNTPRARLGFSARSDLFQHQFGFNPDHSTPLADGRLKDGELRIEASYAERRLELVAGIGAGQSRLAFTDDLVGYVSPSLSIAYTAASLSKDHLYDNGEIHLVDGALPPRLVLGVDAQLQYAPSPPMIQVVKIQRVGITAFADFRFTEKLAVRIGIPVAADLAVRKVDGKDAKLDRQWSIPAFVATLIKL